MAALSRPYNGRPETVLSAFAQQHGDPTGTRSSALSVFVPDALKTGRYDLRPESYVREITVDGQGRAKGAVYLDADGDLLEQEADVFLLACGAIESARLLLLSRSGRFPTGLANGSDLVGRNLTLHEYSAAIGVFEEPIYAWAGGGYVAVSSYQFYEHADDRGFVGGCHIAAAGVGIPLPINWSLPSRPLWGAEAKRIDRECFNHSFAVGMVLHDMPQHDNRVELDDRVTDAWGLPVARITLTPHPNDLAQGRWVIDRNAEILDAAGAKQTYRVYPERITGNCSHQHSTTRMGDDPATSVLNRDCRAHEVDNLYVVDGGPFPTCHGRQPHPDDHGQRLARRRGHRRPPWRPGRGLIQIESAAGDRLRRRHSAKGGRRAAVEERSISTPREWSNGSQGRRPWTRCTADDGSRCWRWAERRSSPSALAWPSGGRRTPPPPPAV
jgi:choline dehydrogenase-like flavoprotein